MQSRARILFLLHLPPPVHGAAMMGKYIKESSYINENFDGDYINLSTAGSLEDIGKGGFAKFLRFIKIQYTVLKALLTQKYDLCYVTLTAKGAGFYKDVFFVFLLKLFRRKIIYHFHNKGVESNRHKKINDLLYHFVFRNTNSILLSSYLYPDIEYYVKKENVFFCANGIPEEPEANVNTLRDSPVCRFLFLSNMMAEKGVYVLLEACKILNEQGISFECHFIGQWSDISESEFGKAIREKNLSGEVFAHGKQYGKDKISFFKNADIFVFPTYYHNETFGLVLVEAMQFGLPVVSTFEGGIPDVVADGETGYLVPQKDVHALVEKLKLLAGNKTLREQMGRAGEKRYKTLFTLENFEHRFSDILKTVVENNLKR